MINSFNSDNINPADQKIYDLSSHLLNKIYSQADSINPERIGSFLKTMQGVYSRGNMVYTDGAGRSGLAIRSFGEFLIRLGFKVNHITEKNIPYIHRNSCFLIASGSGGTKGVVELTENLKSLKDSLIISFTSNEYSSLTRLSDLSIKIPKISNDELITEFKHNPVSKNNEAAVMGTEFEDGLRFFSTAASNVLARGLFPEYNWKKHYHLENEELHKSVNLKDSNLDLGLLVRISEKKIIKEVHKHIDNLKNNNKLSLLSKRVDETYKNNNAIHGIGMGVSGDVTDSLMMRLSHLGFRNVHSAFDVCELGIEKDDLIIIASTSGKTNKCVDAAQKTKDRDGKSLAFIGTDNQKIPLMKLVDDAVVIPDFSANGGDTDNSDYTARMVKREGDPRIDLITPASSQVIFDSTIGFLMDEYEIDPEEMKKRHKCIGE